MLIRLSVLRFVTCRIYSGLTGDTLFSMWAMVGPILWTVRFVSAMYWLKSD